MPRHQLTVLKTVEVSRTGRHCEPDQNLFARGAYTESDKPPARKSGLATRDYLSPPHDYVPHAKAFSEKQ